MSKQLTSCVLSKILDSQLYNCTLFVISTDMLREEQGNQHVLSNILCGRNI